MKRNISILVLACLCMGAFAAQTTYTFTSITWESQVGTVTTDGKTDGWVSNKKASSYSKGYVDAAGEPYGVGVSVKTGTTGAGATSVLPFTNVRKIIVNFCQNKSGGQGEIVVRVGANDSLKVDVEAPQSDGHYLQDVEFTVPVGQSGQITLTVYCTENAININSVTIKADNASPNVPGLTMDEYRLVTDVNDLQDGDQVIFGVADGKSNKIMGVFDEAISKNNIHAIDGVYSADRSTVNENAAAIYTVEKGVRGDDVPYFAFADYTDWYLVASGGKTKNRLAVWDTIYSSEYGWDGAWDVEIAVDGAATITSQGTSLGKIIQYNYNGGTPIFGCYADISYDKVALYKLYTVQDVDAPYIKSGMVNFGTALLDEAEVVGSRKVEVNAINLTEDITATLKNSAIFSIDTTLLDRDGDYITVSYKAETKGHFVDTLVLQSGSTNTNFIISLTVDKRITVAEAKTLDDLTTCYLNPVVVTKKYDKYIFVRDETGSLMLFDGSNLYGKDIANGHVLTNVTGLYKNYYGNPNITLTAAFQSAAGETVLPELQTEPIDSVDACRYISAENATFQGDTLVTIGEEGVPIYDMFNSMVPVNEEDMYHIEGIVYYYNRPVFCPIVIEVIPPTALQQIETDAVRVENGRVVGTGEFRIYDLLGRDVTNLNGSLRGVYIVTTAATAQKVIIK
ncbi:MAG: hypothetical protein ACI392_08725 [Paludibacteraceae bacterium]